MLDCVALGDSIAVGVGHARPNCKVMAVTGITSGRYVQLLPPLRPTQTAIISLGVNDSEDMDTLANLRRLRSEVHAKTVYWMLVGSNPRSRDAVRIVAAEYRDRLIDVAPLAGPDGIHPGLTGYARLAAATHLPNLGTRPQPLPYRHIQLPQWAYQGYPNTLTGRPPHP